MSQSKNGFFYIIKTSDTPENVYKIGKTTDVNPNKRLCKYPKYSQVLYTIHVSDADGFEDLVMRKLRMVLVRRLEYGYEYYECPELKKIIDIVHYYWMKYHDKDIILNKSIESIKPNGIQYFVNEYLSKNLNSTINLDDLYTKYVKIIKETFNSNDYAEKNVFTTYINHVLSD